MRDSYLKFFSKGLISKQEFFEFGLEETIYIPLDEAKKEWENLKNRIQSNKEVYIRGFGRDAAGTHLFQDLYLNLFNNENIKKDPTNNAQPTKLIRELTGYSKNKSSKYKHIRNYQISHIFGRTKNVYAFTAPWNIVYLPKILDPFTGHEAKGDFVEEYTKLFQQQSYKHFASFIDEYNEIVTDPSIKLKLEKYLFKLDSRGNLDAKVLNKLKTAVANEFAPIEINA